LIKLKIRKPSLKISAGENLGWVMKMMGHASLKMITDKYFSYIPNMTHQDGSKFIEEYGKKVDKGTISAG
jgi:integrase